MWNFFNAKILFFMIVLGCSYFILGQFVLEADASKPSQISPEFISGGNMIGDRTTNAGSIPFIRSPAFKNYDKIFKRIYKFISSPVESFSSISTNGKIVTDQATNEDTDNCPPRGIKELRDESIDQLKPVDPLLFIAWLFIHDFSFFFSISLIFYMFLKATWIFINC